MLEGPNYNFLYEKQNCTNFNLNLFYYNTIINQIQKQLNGTYCQI